MKNKLSGLMALGLFLIILGCVMGTIGFVIAANYVLAAICAGGFLVSVLAVNRLSKGYDV